VSRAGAEPGRPGPWPVPTAGDLAAVSAQLGRRPRAVRGVAHRCPCGLPDVIVTSPRLADGSPFPTLFYLTCPRAGSAVGRLEASGVMAEMTERLSSDAELADRYRLAHQDYLRRRNALAVLDPAVSAGGMPDRVKCLHALVAHSLAAGRGVNPFGDEALDRLPDWSRGGPCVPVGRRVAAVDCGTNSVRLLIADVDLVGGSLRDVVRTTRIVRLGEGVDATGRLSDGALRRTFRTLRDYAAAIEAAGVAAIQVVATSATRDAENREVFTAGVRDLFGVAPVVLTGAAEAQLSFLGATRELDRTGAPFLVVDIGGGSTEFVLGGDSVRAAHSVDIGCVRLTERHLRADPPTREQVAAAAADIDAALEEVAKVVPLAEAATLVGLAGSVTTVAALALDLPAYDPVRIHRSRIARSDVHRVASRLLAATRQSRAALPVMHPGRVDVIGSGALILERVCERVELPDVLVSEHDILDGIAWRAAAQAAPAEVPA
jgi:exopolyphosphatase/guanosine-5'-triphosphate,3'-diphosphate pyrophosphatase